MKYSEIVEKHEKQFAFIDESGNYGFDFENNGVTSHFIVTAVIVEESKLTQLENELDSIRKKYFQTGEMKSSSIRNSHKRRIALLNSLKDLEFHTYSIVVDKRLIFKDSALMYKRTFLKYLNNRLHQELYLTFPKLQMVADQQGNKEFMDGFVKYVNKKHQPNLFEEYDFGFINSKDSVLVQLADIICGTLAFGFEEGKDKKQFDQFDNIIKHKRIGLVQWPGSFDSYIYDAKKYKRDKIDDIIFVNCIRLVDEFISKYQDSDVIEYVERVFVLKYLKSMLVSTTDVEYVPSSKIIKNLSFLTKKEYTKHYFKTQIIAKLRDENVIIASSNKGYKIPENEDDLYSFVNHTNSMVLPMFSRLKRARERVISATKGELDILDKVEYSKLKDYLDTID